ncbi:MAG: PhoU domain-containing protein [Candidatus Hodarchaeales archaeon]
MKTNSRRFETRRLQKTGGSSYVITLPKAWLKRIVNDDSVENHVSKLEKKSDPYKNLELGLIIQSDNTILITPNLNGRRKSGREKVVDLNSIGDEIFLYRYLISTYIAGFTELNLKSNTNISLSYMHSIRKFISMVIGMVIIEETENFIKIKDILDPLEMPFPNIIRRQVTTAKNMAKETLESLKNCEINCEKLAEQIEHIDNEVDRLYWLCTRITNMILRDIRLSDLTGISPDLAANFFLVSRHIERIADHVVRIAKNVVKIHNKKIDSEIIKGIEDALGIAFGVFETSVNALFDADINKANKSIEDVKNFEDRVNKLFNFVTTKESPLAIFLDNIIESIRRIGEYSRDISENVMNYLVWEE